MIKSLLFAVVTVLLLAACDLTKNESYIVLEIGSVDSIEVLSTSDLQLKVHTYMTSVEPCSRYSKFVLGFIQDTIGVSIRVRWDGETACGDNPYFLEKDITVDVPRAGDYVFFFSGRTAHMDTLIHISE